MLRRFQLHDSVAKYFQRYISYNGCLSEANFEIQLERWPDSCDLIKNKFSSPKQKLLAPRLCVFSINPKKVNVSGNMVKK